jgi:hypothetical protein
MREPFVSFMTAVNRPYTIAGAYAFILEKTQKGLAFF